MHGSRAGMSYPGRRPKHSLTRAKIQRSRSLTDIHATCALAPSPLRHCAAFDEGGMPVPVAPASAHVGPLYLTSPTDRGARLAGE
ncbi:hypothetical protein FRC12_011216 [Ceratobasidium sp. 428]|nr:hypothetical protein FRC12_011216 [Ceratobasidium sp. 428]